MLYCWWLSNWEGKISSLHWSGTGNISLTAGQAPGPAVIDQHRKKLLWGGGSLSALKEKQNLEGKTPNLEQRLFLEEVLFQEME